MILRARHVVPVDQPPIENGWVQATHGVITATGSEPTPEKALDLGDVALLPGFVNAHTHLQLTRLRGQVPYRGSFAGWIEDLLAESVALSDEDTARESLRLGARESLAAGATTVGDIGYGRHQFDELTASPLRAVCFIEALGVGPRAADAFARLGVAIEGRAPVPRRTWLGISPHAPYSTAIGVYRHCVNLASSKGWPITTHLAESREELRFLADGSGPLRELLGRRHLVDETFVAPRTTPIAFARSVGLLDHPTLLAHVNYVSDAELDVMAQSRCSVAYCPRTHRFFGHEPHRFREMLSRGINVCVATDSLASNDTLSVLDELRFLRRGAPDLSPQTLIEMGTIRGAAALGLDSLAGSLAPGKLADLVAVRVDPHGASDVADAIVSGEGEVTAVYVGGELRWPAPPP